MNKTFALLCFLTLPYFVKADVYRIDPFEGDFSTEFETRPLVNRINSVQQSGEEHWRLESPSSTIAIFNQENLSYAWPLKAANPDAFGFARNGKAISLLTQQTQLENVFTVTVPEGMRVKRIGGYFMFNSNPVTIGFQNPSQLDFTDTEAGDTDNLQWEWLGWEFDGEYAKALAFSHQDLSFRPSFHMDAMTWDLEPVPEPATMISLGAALALWKTRRKRTG